MANALAVLQCFGVFLLNFISQEIMAKYLFLFV